MRDALPDAEGNETGVLTANTALLPGRGFAAGGGYSTTGDLFRFRKALLSNKLLDPSSIDLLTTGKADMAARSGGELRRGSGLRVGIIGLGRIGPAVARRALALRFRFAAADCRPSAPEGVRLVELDVLLATSDIVSVNLRLDSSTRHLLDAAALARMKPGSYLVNTSRGGVVDQAALVDALRSGHLGGACRGIHAGLFSAALSVAATASPAPTRARSASRQTSTARGHHASTWSASPYQCREMTFA
jgi:hypothetical protein